jgi:hypothetical protein
MSTAVSIVFWVVFLFQNSQHILWEHITKIYYEDIDLELRTTKLTYDHIALTPQSRMRVYLAAQAKHNS